MYGIGDLFIAVINNAHFLTQKCVLYVHIDIVFSRSFTCQAFIVCHSDG